MVDWKEWMPERTEDFCKQAAFSDETEFFVTPFEPLAEDAVTITIRTGRDTVFAAFLCMRENCFSMEITRSTPLFDFYSVTIPQAEEAYYFRLEDYENKMLYYTKYGAFEDEPTEGWFQLHTGFQTPHWAKGAVMYQIYPDRFYNGDPTNDVLTGEYSYLGKNTERVEQWQALPKEEDIRRFYGGDLQGIIDKLPYLADLGIEVLYLNPIFVSPSNHKYDIQDYDHVDPHLGKIVVDAGALLQEGEPNTKATRYLKRVTDIRNLEASDALFQTLVEQAHEKGMRVLVDGVFNHCGAFHKWLDKEGIYEKEEKGAFAHSDSMTREYFYWDEAGKYEGWWGHENHPKLNMENSKKLEREIYRIAKKWLSPPFSADGWRLDVAADLGKTEEYNHAFWRGFRKAVKEVSPEALILAEHYGDASKWLTGDQWDSVMNYDGFMEPVSWFFTGMSKHSTEHREDLYNNAEVFWGSMIYQMAKLPIQALQIAMNELSNHDHSRFLTRTNRQVGRLHINGAEGAAEGIRLAVLREAVLLQMTWPGAPTVYYGDEAGMVGWTDPDNRRTYPWGHENQELIAFHREAIALRKELVSLRCGSLKQLFGEQGAIAYGRFTDTERCLVAFNNMDEKKELRIPLWQIGAEEGGRMEVLLRTDWDGFSAKGREYPIQNGHCVLMMPAQSGILLKEV